MKLYFVLIFGLLPVLSSGIYELSVSSIDGASIPISRFNGTKLLIVVLPVSRERKDSLTLLKLDSLSRKYDGKMTILGVPSYEGGFNSVSLASLRQFYSSVMGPQILLTQGMYTNKSSGIRQHALFAWLTDKNKNGHFDEEVKGPGQQFLVNESGQLVGVLDPEINLTDRVLRHMITP